MDRAEFAAHYRSLTDAQLLEIAADWHSLLDDARYALQAEGLRRGLEIEPISPEGPEDMVAYRDLVTVRRYRDLSEAIIARAVVESAGIFCFLKDENYIRLDWQMSNLIGGIRLQVAPEDVQSAEEILSQPVPDNIVTEDLPEFAQPRCPRCTSLDIKWERQGRKAALLSLYLFSLPMPRGSESWHCNSCGLRWADEDEQAQAAEEV